MPALSNPVPALPDPVPGPPGTIPALSDTMDNPDHSQQVPTDGGAKPPSIYVVVRGLVPGIYTDASAVVEAVCNVSAPHVRQFSTNDEARAFWRHALLIRAVHAIMVEAADADLYPIPQPPGTGRRHLKPSWIAGTSLRIQGPARSLCIGELRSELYNYTLDSGAPADGEHWIVIIGRKPGIYNSWYVCY